MKRALLIPGLLALALTGCTVVQPLPTRGPLDGGAQASTALGWQRLLDYQVDLDGASLQQLYDANLACANAAEHDGDEGAAVLCLEAAYRNTFHSSWPRWTQEEARAKLARRLQGIKAEQGRHGAAASYAAMAALSEAYLDSGQAEDDKRSYQQAQARLDDARRRKSDADTQAFVNFMGSMSGSMMSVADGSISADMGTMETLQHTMDYIKEDSAIADASKGLAESERALVQSNASQVQDRAAHLLAAFLATSNEPADYGKAVQKELRLQSGGRSHGAVGAFLELPPPDRSRGAKKEFVQAYQAAEKELWAEDLKMAPLALKGLQLEEPQGGGLDTPFSVSRFGFYLQGFNQGAYNRTINFSEDLYGDALAKDVTIAAHVSSGFGLAMVTEMSSYPGSGYYFDTVLDGMSAQLTFPKRPTATGATSSFSLRFGLGALMVPDPSGLLSFGLGADIMALAVGGDLLRLPVGGYHTTSVDFLGLGLEASVRLARVLKIAVDVPVVAPIATTDSERDAGGLRMSAGLNFVFGPGAPKAEASSATLPVKAKLKARPAAVPPPAAVAVEEGPAAVAGEAEQGAAEAKAKAEDEVKAKAAADAQAKQKAADDAKAKKKADEDAKAQKKADEAKAKLEAKQKAEQAEKDKKVEDEKAELAAQLKALKAERAKLAKEREALEGK